MSYQQKQFVDNLEKDEDVTVTGPDDSFTPAVFKGRVPGSRKWVWVTIGDDPKPRKVDAAKLSRARAGSR